MWQLRPGKHWWYQTGHLCWTVSREVSWSGVWLTVPVSVISALFMLLSQQFISHFIPCSFILQYIYCDGIGCSDDSLWGKPIREYRSSYWYQKSVEWTSVLRSSLCILLNTSIHIKIVHWIINSNKKSAVLAPLSYLSINFRDMEVVICELWLELHSNWITDQWQLMNTTGVLLRLPLDRELPSPESSFSPAFARKAQEPSLKPTASGLN